jgi:hypothetical protein
VGTVSGFSVGSRGSGGSVGFSKLLAESFDSAYFVAPLMARIAPGIPKRHPFVTAMRV